MPAIVLISVTGCASNKTRLAVRSHPSVAVSRTNTLALVAPNGVLPNERALHQLLLEEMSAGGFRLVTPAEADFHFACEFGGRVTSDVALVKKTVMLVPANPAMQGPGVFSSHSTWELGDRPRLQQGIHLGVWPADAPKDSKVQLTWDGFIECGTAPLAPERLRALLKTLLSRFGGDYSGLVAVPQ